MPLKRQPDSSKRSIKQQHNHMKTHVPGKREIMLDDLGSGEIPTPPADVTTD